MQNINIILIIVIIIYTAFTIATFAWFRKIHKDLHTTITDSGHTCLICGRQEFRLQFIEIVIGALFPVILPAATCGLVQRLYAWSKRRRSMRPYDGVGRIMTIDEFRNAVTVGDLIDYDGTGEWATIKEVSNITIRPSDLGTVTPPRWATHVCWYNK